jgi:tetratricopeptide (TPR) repeat protein/tRNA A-37 threonylcarbamoyl transferase component Bud32
MPTSFSSRFDTALGTALQARLRAFERAWQQHGSTTPPRWQDYLPPPGETCPLAFLFWLLAADIDGRVAAGLPALLAEAYFDDDRVRPAAAHTDFLLELVRREYQQRWDTGECARRQEYLERFPHLPEIGDLSVRLKCRGCAQETLLPDEDAAAAGCPHCGCRSTPWIAAPPSLHPTPSPSASPEATFPPSTAPVPPPRDPASPTPPWLAAMVSAGGGTPAPGASSGSRLGRYELGEEIARGGMGKVFLAHDPALNRDLAVKLLKPELHDRPELVRRFVAEAQITAQLPHPGIVPVHELGQDDNGLPFLAMKLVRGQTLEQLLAERNSPVEELPQFVVIFEQVCQAVAFAHSHRVIHRDLKPANIMVGRFGEVQVMDWGLAKLLDEPPTEEEKASAETAASVIRTMRSEATAGLVSESAWGQGRTAAGTVLGTPAYMAPEQAAGQIHKLDERCDVFGLGAILCEILTGSPPHVVAEEWRTVYMAALGELTEAFRRLDGCGADAELVILAKECLAAEVEQRPRDAGEVAQRLAAYQRGVQERLRQAEQERAAAQARVVEERKRRRLAIVLAAVVVLLLLAGGSWAWQLQQQRTRQHEAGQKAAQALERARALLEQGWERNDLATLNAAQVEADRATEIAHSGAAAPAVQQDGTVLKQELAQRLARATRNRSLLKDLLDVSAPRETRTYRSDASGRMIALAQPSLDEQYIAAFRRRWDDLDIDNAPEADVVARLGAEPQPVVEEILAGLDSWMMERRRKNDSEAVWRRLFRLAEQLDRNEHRRQLRRLLAGEWQPSVELIPALTGVSLPWTALAELQEGARWRRLVELRREMDPEHAPVLSVVLLAQVCRAEADAAGAERVLRQAVTARPNEGVLLDGLARLLEERGRRAEAIEWYRAARTLHPELGVALAKALCKASRAEEGAAVLRDLVRQQPHNPEIHIELGNALTDAHKLVEAEAAFRQALVLQPDAVDAFINLAEALREQKKLADAEAACRQAIALQPNSAPAYTFLGNALDDQKRPAEAEAAYHKAIALKPDYAVPYWNLGLTLADQKKFIEAEAAYRQALVLRPDDADTYYNLATTLRQQKRPAEAEAACHKALELRPDDPDTYTSLGHALRDQKKPIEAEIAYRKAIALKSDYAEADINLGHALRDQKRSAEAEAAYRKAIELQPESFEAHWNFGHALRDQNKQPEAETAYRKASQLRPDDPLVFNDLGVVLDEQKKPRDAEAAYRKAIALHPAHANVWLNLGHLLSKQAKFVEAEAAYRKAIELQPDLVLAYSGLGAALGAQKKPAAAEEAYRNVIALKPEDGTAYANLGTALRAQKKLSEAEAALRKAIEIKPEYANAYNELGNLLWEQRKLPEAEAALRKAIALQPTLARTHVSLGIVLHQQRQTIAAEAAFRKAIELQPDLVDAHINLAATLGAQQKPAEAEVEIRKAITLKPDDAMAHANLGIALRAQKKLTEAEAAFRKADQLRPFDLFIRAQLRQTQQLLELDRKLDACLADKDHPASAEEAIKLASWAAALEQYRAAARFAADAFRADPKLTDVGTAQHRYNGACWAALAVAGKGKGAAALGEPERARLRQQALDWLRADLKEYSGLLEKNRDAAPAVHQRLAHWRQDPDLAGLRDPVSMAHLPDAERDVWKKLWADVEALGKRTAEK